MEYKLDIQMISLSQDALIKAFWRKKSLRLFLKQLGIQDAFLNSWHEDETKRDFIYRLFDVLLSRKDNSSQIVILRIAESLAKMTEFPDLENWEDSKEKKASAKDAVYKLKKELERIAKIQEDEKEVQKRRKEAREERQRALNTRQSLNMLAQELSALVSQLGTTEGGYAFEKWLYRLFNYFEILSRPPYWADGRQIDGSITFDGTTFLIEAKFQKDLVGSDAIDVFYSKVVSKADNTMGILISMSGFTSGAIKTASRNRTPILLMDYSHFFQIIFPNIMSLKEVILRIKRHASQTGEAYLATMSFSD